MPEEMTISGEQALTIVEEVADWANTFGLSFNSTAEMYYDCPTLAKIFDLARRHEEFTSRA